jgi:hypothetical protein
MDLYKNSQYNIFTDKNNIDQFDMLLSIGWITQPTKQLGWTQLPLLRLPMLHIKSTHVEIHYGYINPNKHISSPTDKWGCKSDCFSLIINPILNLPIGTPVNSEHIRKPAGSSRGLFRHDSTKQITNLPLSLRFNGSGCQYNSI